MTSIPVHPSDPPWLPFYDLMPYRVREVLLVSSLYDYFILQEDGHLSERIFIEYSELNLSWAPRIIHAPSGAAALELLEGRRIDLIITMVRLEDMNVGAFGESVKQRKPELPVVLLALTDRDLQLWAAMGKRSAVDLVFRWTGDSRILLAIIKQVEDRMNAEHDTQMGDVQVIIVVEDSVRRWSSLLSVVYSELMAQSQSLIAEGLNDLHRLVRMRARPKLLLARDFEEALRFYQQYRRNLLAVITDIQFPREGQEDPEAGLRLVTTIQADDPEIPLLLQSAAEDGAFADESGVLQLDQHGDVLGQIRQFLNEYLGFGDFVFRLPDGTEVGRARGMYEMERVLESVPAASLEYHAARNHISLWLNARCMFALARQVRCWTVADSGGAEGIRSRLIAALQEKRRQEQDGVIADYRAGRSHSDRPFVRLGTGSIGGKARGIAFASSLVVRDNLNERFGDLRICVPKTVVLASDAFDRFIQSNGLQGCATHGSDEEVLAQFLRAPLPEELLGELRTIHEGLDCPVAVRSSSLLEDAHSHPFAGIYATYMLPNTHPEPEARFSELCQSIKAVYASTYSQNARAYTASTPWSLHEEKMAVIIQEMVGQRYRGRFYPTISGVALSYNYYPVGCQRAGDGLVLMALGLGHIIVQGGGVLQFSPGAPTVLPQYASEREQVGSGQSTFLALDLSRDLVDFTAPPESSLGRYGLAEAEADGSLWAVGSVYVREQDRIRDRLDLPGPRVVTFNNILRWKAIALVDALRELLHLFRRGMGCPVEIEFAVEMGDYGRDLPRGRQPLQPCLHILQIRPQASLSFHDMIPIAAHQPEDLLCQTNQSLGQGVIDNVRDIVYLRQQELAELDTTAVAQQIDRVNQELRQENCPYLLIGPGRWGSSDGSLGIPVVWRQIAGARVIIETQLGRRAIEASQGSHFFHNIIAFEIGYLSVGSIGQLDQAWLDAQPAHCESADVRHVRLPEPLGIYLNGREGQATILKPLATV